MGTIHSHLHCGVKLKVNSSYSIYDGVVGRIPRPIASITTRAGEYPPYAIATFIFIGRQAPPPANKV
jgi:hypothetical protein